MKIPGRGARRVGIGPCHASHKPIHSKSMGYRPLCYFEGVDGWQSSHRSNERGQLDLEMSDAFFNLMFNQLLCRERFGILEERLGVQ